MEGSKLQETIKKIIYAISIIVSIIFVASMYIMGSIPINYIIIVAGVLLALLVGEYYLIFYKKKPRSKRSIITQIFSLILSIVMVIGCIYMYQIKDVVDLMSESSFQSRAISVIVLLDSEIADQDDLADKNLGYISYIDEESMNYAINDINSHIGLITTTDYTDFTALLEALYNKNVDAIILDEAFREIATTDYPDFDDETRVVYQIEKIVSSVNSLSVNVTESPFIIYISGNDEYGELSAVSRTDTNMIVVANPNTKQILLLSIPRDIYIPLNRNGQYDKFTHSGIYGISESVLTLEDLLDEQINYYVRMNFTSFMDIVDAIGGVTIDVPQYECLHSDDGTFTTKIGGYTISPGINDFDAKEALSFVRERKSFVAGDFVRGQNQQLMLKAIFDKVCSPQILTSFSSILNTVSKSIETNFSSDEINSLIQFQLIYMPSWDIQSYQIQGYTDNRSCYSLGYQEASVVVPYYSSVVQASEYINQMMANEVIDISGDEEETEETENSDELDGNEVNNEVTTISGE